MIMKNQLKNKILVLPKQRPKNVSILDFVLDTLSKYRIYLTELDSNCNIFSENATHEELKRIVRILSDGIYESIRLYLLGFPHEAYCNLKKCLEDAEIMGKADLSVNQSDYNFYRARKIGKNDKIESKYDMFHIPFNFIEKVGNERFSISGSPALYLGSNVFTCFKELNVKSNQRNNFYISKVKIPNKTIRFFDLRIHLDQTMKKNEECPKDMFIPQVYLYLMMFPLVFASSIKTAYPKEKFKPEYIIPNLLMQWVRGLNEYEHYFGILYSSTKINKNDTDMPQLFYNAIIPSRLKTKDNEFCYHMLNQVQISNPINCGENFEKVKPVFGEYYLVGSENNVNEHLKSFVYSLSENYGFSPFANIEHILDKEKTQLLVFENQTHC